MAQSMTWRALPISTLTYRQFLGGRAIRVVIVLSLLPCLFAAIYLLNPEVNTPAGFLTELFLETIIAPTLLPIIVLIVATAALGNEVEDRTLPYLTLKPISRLRIVLEKLLAVLVVTLPPVLIGLALTGFIVGLAPVDTTDIFPGDPTYGVGPVIVAMLVAAAAGVVLISSVFLALSLIVPRALLAGIVYVFVWESLLGRFLPGIRVVSIRHYVQSIFVDVLDDPMVTVEGATSLQASFIVIAVVVVISIILATWRLRTMNLD
jgi:ABC-2 type transport system permease protein